MAKRKPNFFILGAPKCGTTSLAHWLAQHSRVFVTPSKEPHHYNTDMRHRIFPEADRYDNLFANADQNHLAIGEASVWYLYSREAVPNIEERHPGSRYIVCLRNPTDMYHSLHMQQLFSGNEVEENPEKAWHLSTERKQGRQIPPAAIDPMTLIYDEACALGSQLQRLYSYVSQDRVHVILLDDMARSPEKIFGGVLGFLGVPGDLDVSLLKQNEAKVHRSAAANTIVSGIGRAKQKLGIGKGLGILSRLESINTKIQKRVPLDPEFRGYLVEHFQPEVEILSQILKVDLEAWNA